MEGKQDCSACKKTLPITSFSLKKGKEYYKTCDDCRKKVRNKKDTEPLNKENNKGTEVKINKDINDEKKKTRNYQPPPRVCNHILKEQNFECRGPGENDCKLYECPLKKANIKFSDIKSPTSEIDHILPVSEGGNNDLVNFQALCGCCHNEKTKMEGLIKSNGGLQDKLVLELYNYLSRPKYYEVSSDSDDEPYISSDSDSDDEYINFKTRSELRKLRKR